MAKGFVQTGVETGEFVNIPDKNYTVNGIARFITTDDSENPIFTDQKNKLVTWLKLRTSQGDEGPAISVTAPEFVGLVRALGGKGFAPKQPASTSALLEGQKLANAGSKELVVESKNGWASIFRMRDVIGPPDMEKYTVEFAGVNTTAPGVYNWLPTGGLYFNFRIVGDGNQQPSIWDGFELSRYMENPFAPEVEINGKKFNAVEQGIPVWVCSDKGYDTGAVKQWKGFIQFFVPDVLEHDWVVDPAQSSYGVSEVLSPHYVIIDLALKAKRRVVIALRPKREGYTGSTFDLKEEMLTKYNDSFQPIDVDAKTVTDLVEYIKLRFPVINLFESEQPMIFNEEGREWAAQYLGGESGPWVAAGLDPIKRPPIETLTSDQITKLYDEMTSRYGAPEGW